MKIAVWHNLPSGGGKRALYQHVEGLIGRGHEVESWCPATANQEYLPLASLCPEYILPLDFKQESRWRLPFARSWKMHQRIEAMDSHCRACADQINARGFDILFASSCRFYRVTSIARYVKTPSVIYLHEPYRPLYEALPRLPWAALPAVSASRRLQPSRLKAALKDQLSVRSLRIRVREERDNAAAFDRILVNSLFSRESVLRAYGLNSYVCYLGVDFRLFSPTDESVEDYVIGLGALDIAKGADRAVRAIGRIPKNIRPRLVWIGNFSDPAYESDLRILAESHGVTLEVRVMVSDAELRSALSRARAMIYTPRLEPFGLAPLEANACGVPVVGIAEGGVRESIHHGINGFLVDSDDPKALAEALMAILRDAPGSNKLRLSSLDHVRKNWTMPKAIDRLEESLEATIREFGTDNAQR